jgi:hypothetical protein
MVNSLIQALTSGNKKPSRKITFSLDARFGLRYIQNCEILNTASKAAAAPTAVFAFLGSSFQLSFLSGD